MERSGESLTRATPNVAGSIIKGPTAIWPGSGDIKDGAVNLVLPHRSCNQSVTDLHVFTLFQEGEEAPPTEQGIHFISLETKGNV